MSDQIKISDFSAGWCPSDDANNGRKNGLLKMTGVTLDENGALVLAQGTQKGATAYPSNAHTLFSKFVCGSRHNYLALADGSVYKDASAIIAAAAGATDRAAFGVYGDFALIFSGNSRVKDGCDGVISLAGQTVPQMELILNAVNGTFYSDAGILGTLSNWLHNYSGYVGTFTIISAGEFSVVVDNPAGDYVISYDVNAGSPDFPKDLSGSDDDIFSFRVISDKLSQLSWVEVSFDLDVSGTSNPPPAAPGTVTATSIFNKIWSQDEILAAAIGNTAILTCKRSDFTKNGDSPSGWESIQGFAVSVAAPNSITGAVVDYSNFKFSSGGNINGTYEYVQVNVYNVANYVAFSKLGPVAPAITVNHGQVEVIPEDPTPYDQSINEVWIYRRGGNLSTFYRVAVITLDDFGPFYDNLTDDDVIALGRKWLDFLTVNSTDLPDKIIEMVGPVHGRMLYFSSSQLFFSEINSPENYNPEIVMNIAGDDAEILLFARKASENVVIIGTTRDLYLLTGSFITFPDGTLDVQLRPMGVDKPPISQDVAVYKNGLIYFTAQGWVHISTSGQYTFITHPNTDQLYIGKLRHEYGGVPTYTFSDVRYSVALSSEILFVSVPTIEDYTDPTNKALWGRRLEVYDFVRKYWRPLNYAPELLTVSDDGAVFGFFNSTKRLNLLNYAFSKLLNKT